MDIFHKSPDTRTPRWWRIPIPTKEYKDNYNDIFKKRDQDDRSDRPGDEGGDSPTVRQR